MSSVGVSLQCCSLPAGLGFPCSVGGLPAVVGSLCSVGGLLAVWGLPAAWGPGGHQSCCLLTWCPSALSAVSLDHFQILRAIGKGSFGKVRLRAGPGWTRVGEASCLGLVERVGMLPTGQASDARGLGWAAPEPATTRLSWPRSLGSCSSAGSWGCRWHIPGLFWGRDPEATCPSHEPRSTAAAEWLEPGRDVLEKLLRGGRPPVSGAQRPGLCWPSLQAGRGRTQVAATRPCPTLAPQARSPLSRGRIQAPDCSLILPGDRG